MKKIMMTSAALLLSVLVAGCAAENPVTTGNETPPAKESTVRSTDDDNDTDDSDTKDTKATTTASEISVSLDEAIKAYQDTYPDSDITAIDLESSLGSYVYAIEGVDDSQEYEVKIDAASKEIKKQKEEKLDADEQKGIKRQEDQLDLTDLLSLDEISKIATKEAQGEAVEWGLDQELNTTYWDVKVQDAGKETDVKIDAKTGEVLEVELDD